MIARPPPCDSTWILGVKKRASPIAGPPASAGPAAALFLLWVMRGVVVGFTVFHAVVVA